MQSTLKIEQVDKNTIAITSQHLIARIMMNARDAMVHAVVDKIDAVNGQQDLEQLKHYLYEQCGGKTSLHLPEGADLQTFVDAGFSAAPSYDKYKIITRAQMDASLDDMLEKNQVQGLLQNITDGKWHFVDNETLLQDPKALFKFKKAHADFVNEDKCKDGIYSTKAEHDKLQNPNVMHFALKKDEQILATFMVNVFGNHLYFADLIVHQDRWNEKLAQALLVKSYQAIFAKHPNIADAWLIAGGHGLEPDGKHLYDVVLTAQNIDEAAQRKHGMIIKLTGPGPVLLKAANRDLQEPHHSLDQKAPKMHFGLAQKQPKVKLQTPPEQSEDNAQGATSTTTLNV